MGTIMGQQSKAEGQQWVRDWATQIISQATVVGFSGARQAGKQSLAVLNWVARQVHAEVLVGDARGIDTEASRLFPNAHIYHADDFLQKAEGNFRSALALRSMAMVQGLKRQDSLLVAFPERECPEGVMPDRYFQGNGSGTWGTVAYAIGIGVRCMIWLAPELAAPSWLHQVGRGWWFFPGIPCFQGTEASRSIDANELCDEAHRMNLDYNSIEEEQP